MPGAAVLEVRIKAKAFASDHGRSRQILRHINFSAEPGEVLALVGPSGIGKSTVLRIALALDNDFDGTARLPPGRIGVMFQEPRLLPWLTVAQNLRLVCAKDEPAPNVTALLDEVLLPRVAALLPGELSLGMARRVALARALAVDPRTLVLDEPFASLDRQLGAALGSRIADRARRHSTLVLLSTHDLDHALAMADRILVLSGQPATLAADAAVSSRDDRDARGRLRQDLLADFPFLGTATENGLAAC